MDSYSSKRKPVRIFMRKIHSKHTQISEGNLHFAVSKVRRKTVFHECSHMNTVNTRRHKTEPFYFCSKLTSFCHSRHHLLEHFSNRCRLRRRAFLRCEQIMANFSSIIIYWKRRTAVVRAEWVSVLRKKAKLIVIHRRIIVRILCMP